MNCTLNIDEELNYIDLFKKYAGFGRIAMEPKTESMKHLNGMYVSAFAFCVSLIAPGKYNSESL